MGAALGDIGFGHGCVPGSILSPARDNRRYADPPALCSGISSRVTLRVMNTAIQPNVKFVQTPDYRETYANSVQIRVNVWDFFLVFGTMQQSSETQAEMRNFQGIYLSPQQAKALTALLQQNVMNYESAFGEIKLDPRAPGGPIH
jgi:hypothetical protein